MATCPVDQVCADPTDPSTQWMPVAPGQTYTCDPLCPNDLAKSYLDLFIDSTVDLLCEGEGPGIDVLDIISGSIVGKLTDASVWLVPGSYARDVLPLAAGPAASAVAFPMYMPCNGNGKVICFKAWIGKLPAAGPTTLISYTIELVKVVTPPSAPVPVLSVVSTLTLGNGVGEETCVEVALDDDITGDCNYYAIRVTNANNGNTNNTLHLSVEMGVKNLLPPTGGMGPAPRLMPRAFRPMATRWAPTETSENAETNERPLAKPAMRTIAQTRPVLKTPGSLAKRKLVNSSFLYVLLSKAC